MSTETKTIWDALVSVNKSITVIAKNGYNDIQHFAYAPIEEVYPVCRDAMNDAGVVMTTEILGNEMTQTTTTKGNKINYASIVTSYQFHCGGFSSNPFRWIGEAMDTGDKTYSKAISFSQKTFLVTFFNIPRTKSDPDSSSIEGPAKNHTQKSYSKPYPKSNYFYLTLFAQKMDWARNTSPPAKRKQFQTLCKILDITPMMVDWKEAECEIMRSAITEMAGIEINYRTPLSKGEIETIEEKVSYSLLAKTERKQNV